MANSFWKSVVALPLLAGCYQYVPANRAGLAAATPVSIDLSARGTVNVANKIGNNVMTLEGNVTEASPSSVTISLQSVRRRGETAKSTWNGESITLASEDIDEVKTRRISRSRTTVASAALAAASVGLIVGIAKATGAASGSTGGRPTPNP